MFDLIFSGGRVIDGSGSPWFYADVGISGERIEAVGKLDGAEAKRRIEVKDRVVCPGFVDAHVHGDLVMLAEPLMESAVRQGVTTFIVGQDGCGMASASPPVIDYMRRYTAGFTGSYPDLDCSWKNVDEYLARFDRRCAINAAFLVPNGTLRMEVMGPARRPATSDEIAAMRRLAREGMEQGAVGLSTGLDYIPSLYADTHEIAELCKEIVPFDGVYVTHYRNEAGRRTHEAIDEVYEIGRRSGCLLHISHFNVRADEFLPRIDEGRRAGFDITYDTYPYLAGMTILSMVGLPLDVQEGGVDATLERLADPETRQRVRAWYDSGPRVDPQTIQLAHIAAEKYRGLEGTRLADAARESGMHVAELICELLVESRLAAGGVVFSGGRTENDILAVMNHPCHMAGSDGIYTGRFCHPRGWGAYAKFLGTYVRDKKAWSLETAISHLSYHGSRRYRLPDRGLVRRGMIADLVVFDPNAVEDVATYESPRQFARGVDHVLVGGQFALDSGRMTGVLNGRGLRRAT